MKDLRILRKSFALALTLAATSVTLPATGQEGKVQDLTDQEVTAKKLVEILQPEADVARDIGVTPKPHGRPHCEILRQNMSRGIGVRPKTDIAALQILFDFNSAKIQPAASHTLDELGKALSSSALGPYCFQIEGHTDAIGLESYNNQLSRQRAEAVVQYLAAHFGVDAERLVATGYGKSKPIADNATEAGRAKNRRVQVVNLGSGDS